MLYIFVKLVSFRWFTYPFQCPTFWSRSFVWVGSDRIATLMIRYIPIRWVPKTMNEQSALHLYFKVASCVPRTTVVWPGNFSIWYPCLTISRVAYKLIVNLACLNIYVCAKDFWNITPESSMLASGRPQNYTLFSALADEVVWWLKPD